MTSRVCRGLKTKTQRMTPTVMSEFWHGISA